MDLLVCDFESYYSKDYSLSSSTTEEYVRSPRFETIGVGCTTPTGRRKWFEHAEFKKLAPKMQWDKIAVLAHHAHFDMLILSHHYGIRPAYIFDTLSMGRLLHGISVGGSLAKLANHYQAGVKGDEVVQAFGKRRADFTPSEWAQYGQYCLNDCDLTYRIFQKMLPLVPKVELDMIDLTVKMFTTPMLVLDQPKMEEYLQYEVARKAELLERVGADKDVFLSNEQFAVLLERHGVSPRKKPTSRKQKDGSYKQSETWAFAKTDSFMQELLEHEDDEIRWLAEARVGVKSTINETRTSRYLSCAKRGPMPVYLKYAAAHTLRWGGGDKMNWQNLQRVQPDKPETGIIRKSIQAPEGYMLVVADSAQIEARVTAYLAGETWLLDAFREGRDVYSEFASEMYGRPITKADTTERFCGKTGILGLGYGLGWLKYADTMLKGAMGGPPVVFGVKELEALNIVPARFLHNPNKVTKVEEMLTRLPIKERLVHCMVAEEFVRRYRYKNRKIVALWDYMSALLAQMNEDICGDAGLPIPIKVVHHGLQLEGGSSIHYPGLEYDYEQYTYTGGKSGRDRVKAYGGSVTENVVQWLARCIVGEQMVNFARACPAAHIALMTHDEIVACAPEELADGTLSLLLDTMKTPPSWAPGLPLNAEGGVGRVYGEIK